MNEHYQRRERPIIGITCGDLNGVGIEVILKTLLDHRMVDHCIPLILCSPKIISFYTRLLNIGGFRYCQAQYIEKINPMKTNILKIWDDQLDINPGKPSKENSIYTFKSLEIGVSLLKDNKISALVTAPLNKELIQQEQFKFPGHTEYLIHSFGMKDGLMFMVHDDLRIGVVTGHIPVNLIPERITKDLIMQKIKIMKQSLFSDFGISKPKIAVLGLNPHAGEGGLLGNEEEKFIIPAIKSTKEEAIIMGPFAADGFFGSCQHKNFDGVLAMYHDQGLIPFKQYTFGQGVNFTAGLPFIRTSPDHGTAYHIAGKNVADSGSMREAIFTAINIWKNRKENF